MSEDFNVDRIAQATGDRTATSDQILWGFKVIKMIIGADEIHEAEAAGLRATMQQFGASEAMIRAIDAFDPKSVELHDLLAIEAASYGLKRLIYAAVVVAWADDRYSAPERAAVAAVASFYKISPSTVAAIEHLVTVERELAALRLGLLAD
jgi:hypothetical protein